jgi:outer membrane protein
VVAVASLVAAASAARAAEGDWLFRGGVSVLNPKETNLPGALGGDIVFDKAPSATFTIAYMVSKHVASELMLAWPFDLDIQLKNAAGTTTIGDTELFPPTLSLQWHFNPDGRVDPYLGAGINYTTFSRNHLDYTAAGLPQGSSFEPDHSLGAAGQLGVNWYLNERWFLNAEVRWIDLDSDVTAKLPAAEPPPGAVAAADASQIFRSKTAEIDPWVYGLHIGYGSARPELRRRPHRLQLRPQRLHRPSRRRPPPPVKCSDGDKDGVCDADDKCAGTAAGLKVDRVGCPLEQRIKVVFDSDSAELRPESIDELERLVKFMGDVPFATALIEGHTDSVGAAEYNQRLSDRRAKAVFDYLTSRGVDPARLKSVGKGESDPVADNKTAEGRQQNRRVLMIRTDSGGQ